MGKVRKMYFSFMGDCIIRDLQFVPTLKECVHELKGSGWDCRVYNSLHPAFVIIESVCHHGAGFTHFFLSRREDMPRNEGSVLYPRLML